MAKEQWSRKPGDPCPRCEGAVHLTKAGKPACIGHRGDGQPCRRSPDRGCNVCGTHGAKAPAVKAAAEGRQLRAEAERAVATYGLARDIDPIDAILEEIHWTAGHVAWLREKVQSLPADDLVWGTTEEAEKQATEFSGTDTTRAAAVNVWLQLYRAERKHLVGVCATAAKLGIEERRVKLAERQGALIVEFITQLLGDPEFGLTPEKQEVGRVIAARHLRLLAASE